MGTQLVGNAKFEYDTGPTIVLLGSPLGPLTLDEIKTRFVETPMDPTAPREVVTVGSEVHQLTGVLRFHDDRAELEALRTFGLDGGTVTYFPDGTTPNACQLVSMTIESDRDRAGLGEYESRIVLYREDGAPFAGLL